MISEILNLETKFTTTVQNDTWKLELLRPEEKSLHRHAKRLYSPMLYRKEHGFIPNSESNILTVERALIRTVRGTRKCAAKKSSAEALTAIASS